METMTFENCNLFKRSFTTQGIGFTFNSIREAMLIKDDFRSTEFSHNKERDTSLMASTNSKHFLHVVIENNAEEVQEFEKSSSNTMKRKPSTVSVSLHNPKEPADTKFIPIKSIQVPLGYSTKILITPQARDIDESGMVLTESQRGCRLDEDTDALDIFNVYTRTACLLECKMKYAATRCGCTPWYYPVDKNEKVGINLFGNTINSIDC